MSAPTRTSAEIIAASKDPNLAEYIRKRDFEGTPEPAPGSAEGQGNSFVIHKHRATRLHYDVRLERNAALPSWAVPKGLPTVKGDKRLAVRTEDHPAGVREVRRHDPGGPLRRRRGPDLRRRLVRADRVGRREEGLVQAPRAALSGPGVPLRQDPHRLARVPGQRAGRAVDRVAPPVPADARGGRLEGVRRRRLVVRAQARRHPLPRRDDDRRDEAHHALRPRRDVAVPRHPHDPRAGRPGERRPRRRDRRVRRRGARTRSRRCSSA